MRSWSTLKQDDQKMPKVLWRGENCAARLWSRLRSVSVLPNLESCDLAASKLSYALRKVPPECELNTGHYHGEMLILRQ